jgi:hypothetical protein
MQLIYQIRANFLQENHREEDHHARQAVAQRTVAAVVQLQRYTLPLISLHHAFTWKTTNNLPDTYILELKKNVNAGI